VAASAQISGLSANTLYHYRVVATTATGSAVGADKTFKTRGPTITSVTFTGSPANPTISIAGTDFGSEPAGTAAGCGATGDDFGNLLWLSDVSAGWAAGQGGDCIGLIVSSYSATQIVFTLGSYYTAGDFALKDGDTYQVTVIGKTFSGAVSYS
jgi:hypothetical protein